MIEGPREARLRRNRGPWTADKLVRKALKHAVYLVLAFALAHLFIAYFVSLPRLYAMVLGAPEEHPAAFAWAAGLTAAFYFNFSWFREQLCLIVCPYGRLQSVLTDHDTMLIGYDVRRGEPRGKVSDKDAGACVDCRRCVVVCPTGIDIRNGLQVDCIGCARCIDACDAIMDKLARPRGLVRYDSYQGLAGAQKTVLRPRTWLYAALGVCGLAAATLGLRSSGRYEANLLRLQGAPPFVIADGLVRNAFEVHLVNKRSAPTTFTVAGQPEGAALQYTIAMPRVRLQPLAHQRVPVFVSFGKGHVRDGAHARLLVTAEGSEARVLEAPLLAPR